MKKTAFVWILLATSLCLFACEHIMPSEETTTTTVHPKDSPTIRPEESTSIPVFSTTKFNIDKNDPCYHVIKEIEDVDIQLLRYVYYAYYDIDGDGTEELLTGWGGSLERVYTIRNGVAVRQEQYFGPVGSDFSETRLFKNGTIRVNSDNDSGYFFSYYRFEGGEIKGQLCLKRRLEHERYRREYDYSKDPVVATDIPITKAEFDRLRKEFEGDGQVVELDWKPLAEYGR